MKDAPPAQPVFLGGTVADHVLFVVALCRFQHHSLGLAAVHYLTWSVVHVALHSIAFTLFGPAGCIVLGIAVTAWAIRMDVAVGVLLGVLEVGYGRAAIALVPAMGFRTGPVVALALLSLVSAIVIEARSHVVLQGYPPRPPRRIIASLPASQKGIFVPYFVVTFGLFFLTLDLAARLLGHRRDLHRRANAVASGWHEEALEGAPADSRETDLHRRAIAELA
jgi:hypothetical protein